MTRNTWTIALLALAMVLVACEKGSEPVASEETTTGIVEVAADGSEFDPPVQLEQIPPGAWICDMGTVHYAAWQEGDGTCPICGMNLRQIATEDPVPAPPAEPETAEEPPATPPAPTTAPVAPPAAPPTPTTAPAGP